MAQTQRCTWLLYPILIVTFCMVACTPPQPATGEQTTPSPVAVVAPSPTIAPEPSSTPTPTLTPSPTIVVNTPTATVPPPTPTPSVTPTPTKYASTPYKDQTLRTLRSGEPQTIDPQHALTPEEIRVVMRVYEGLLAFNDRFDPVPAQAESYSVSSDGRTYTFVLRKGLKYSDGQPLTARNFEYGWKRLFDPELASEYAEPAYIIAGAEAYHTAEPRKYTAAELQALRDRVGVRATSDTELVINLVQPAPYILSLAGSWAGMPVREDQVKAGGEGWSSDATGKFYTGNGPFILRQFGAGATHRYVPNPNYRLGAPTINIEERPSLDQTAALEAYRKGEIDLLQVQPLQDQSILSDAVLAKEIVRTAENCTGFIALNLSKAPFNNIKVRQAFAQALNRQEFVSSILQGRGKPAHALLPPIFPASDQEKTWEFNVTNAMKNLSDAGYAGGANLPEIKLNYARQEAKAVSEWVQAQLKTNLNVNIKLEQVPEEVLNRNLLKQETMPHLYFSTWCARYPDPQAMLSQRFDSLSVHNQNRWRNADFDKLVRVADHEFDRVKRLKYYNDAQKLLVNDVPVIFLNHSETVWLVKPYLTGFRPSTADYYPGQSNITSIVIADHQ